MTRELLFRGAAVIVVGLLLLAVARQPSEAATNDPRPAAASAPNRATVTQSGARDKVTARFRLEGDYRLEWTATDVGKSTRSGCAHFAHLRPGSSGDVSGRPGPQATDRGTTYVYGLDDDQYHFEVISGCEWTLTLVPI